MLFNSIDFAFFLPIVFCLFWMINGKDLKYQNLLLLASSYVFYGWWDWRFLSLLAFSSGLDFFVGSALYKQQDEKKRKMLFLISMGVNLGLLGFFKYYNFFAESFVEAFSFFGQKTDLNTLNIILPVGISFYTFQSMSYAIDIYRGKLTPTKDLIAFLAFVSFFPQLVAGPIERASHLLPQFLTKKRFSYDMVAAGLKIMLWGFFMKVVVADRLALYVQAVYGNVDMHTGLSFIVATIFFAFQIYCDFGGYSLIALGCARLFGFDLMENFRRPYFSGSFREFWGRWHISLSTWFKDYLYIPLGGNRVSPSRNYFNLFTTFVVSGLWHGANWTFVIWGGIHGSYQILEREFAKIGWLKLPKVLQVVLVFALTCFAWIFFRAASLHEAMHIVTTILTHPGGSLYTGDLGIFAFSIMAILMLLTVDYINEYYPDFSLLNHQVVYVRFATIVIMLIYIVSLGVFDGSQFIYFQF
ncbi:MAG: MBOAT family protein [Lewinellaceae bacterium]|nr:MBOAT family protein [Lewinellaceae bacterium]